MPHQGMIAALRGGHRAFLTYGFGRNSLGYCGPQTRNNRLVTPIPPAAARHSRDDFQRRDPVTFKLEEEPKVRGAARKIAGQPARHDELAVLLFASDWLACVLI